MKLVKVLIPFKESATDKLHNVGDEVSVSDETISKALAINPNMLLVIGEGKAEAKPKAKPKAKAE